MRFIAQEVRELMAQLGFRTVEEMVGQCDRLETSQAINHYKAQGLDLSPILHLPPMAEKVGRFCSMDQDHGLEKSLDYTTLIPLCEPALEHGETVNATFADP